MQLGILPLTYNSANLYVTYQHNFTSSSHQFNFISDLINLLRYIAHNWPLFTANANITFRATNFVIADFHILLQLTSQEIVNKKNSISIEFSDFHKIITQMCFSNKTYQICKIK